MNDGPLSVVSAGLKGGLEPDGKPQDTIHLIGVFSSSNYDRNNQHALVQKSGELQEGFSLWSRKQRLSVGSTALC